MAKQNKEEQFRSIIFNDPLKIRQDEEKNQAPANVKVEYRDGPVKEHIEYDHATGTKTIVKSTIPKTNTKQSTTPAPFKPRTLLETTITRGNDNTKVNTNNRFESRFIPRTERNSNADSLSQSDRFLSLDKKEIEKNKKEIELAKNNPNSLYYKQNYKKRFYDIEERGYKEGVTKELNELASGLNEPKIRENVNGKLTEAEAYIVNGMQDYEKNSANDAHNIGEVNEYGFAPAQFMSEQEINNYMYLRGKYDEYIADLYYLKTDAYNKYNKEISSAKTYKGFYEKVKENPAIGYIAIPTLTVASGIMGLMAGAEQTINKVTGDNTVNFINEEAAFKTDAIGMTERAIQDSTDNKFLKFAHSAGTELAEELGENMLPGGEKVWGTGSGIARKYTELAQYGVDLSSTEAYIAAMTSGGMNAVDLKFTKSGGQKIGKYLTRNMKGGTLKTIIGNTAGSVLSGMGAQVSRAVIDDIVDATILNDKGRYATVYKQYTEDGLTAEEANKKAILDAYVTPVVDAAVIGGIFGAAVSVPNTVSASVDFTKRGANIKNEFYRFNVNDRLIEDAVIKQGLKQDKNSDAYKNAKLLENKVNKGRVLDNSEIGAQDILNQIEVYKTYEYSRAMEELTGARIELGADLPPEADGSYSNGTIKVSANSEGDARTTIKHEGGHLLKDGASDIYTAYEARLKDNVTFSKVTDSIKAKHKDAGKTIDDKTAESEAAAEIGMALMPKTVEDLNRLIRRVEGNRTLYDRIHNGIRALRTFMYAKGKKTFVDPETGFKMNYGEMLKLEKTLEDALVKVRGAEFKGGEAKNLIKKIDGTDKLYVKADRQVIKGDTPEEWGKSVESYINDTIRQGKDVEFIGADGDVLTITADTSGKAKFRNNITRPDGRITPMNDAEYMTKLTAESHIDELAEVSKRGKYWVPDSKNHDFAKDGFNYRTAYFEDFDGKYYRLTISVGKNGEIKSVYNVGKIKEVPSNFVAQRPGATKTPSSATSKNIVPENADGVKYKLKSPDVIKYGKNIENVFRDMRLSNVTDDEIKGFAGVTRQMIDYVINARDYSADDFVTQLDETVDAEVSKGSRSIGETIDITNTIIYEIRHISLADIGKREASAYTTMQTEAAAGRATGEVYANARAELNDLRKRKAIITGVFSEPPKNRGEYALSSVGKKSYKIMPDAKNKAEFDASVEDRLDKFVYRVTSNEESAEYGMKYVATHDNDDTLTYLENKTAWDEYDMATAAALVGEFNALGESERAAEFLSVLSARATQAGKTAQATSHVYKLNASGKIEWWIKSNERATERDINSRDNKNALNAKEAECKVADARERAAAKELLSESDTEYRKLSDEESRLKKDLAARNEGKKKALQLQIELEERKIKADKDAELISTMLDADKRAQARRAERVREERHRELLKKLEVGDDEINRIMAEAKESPEEYDEFFMLMDAYYEVSGRAAKDLLKEVYNPKDRQKIIDALKEQKTLNTEILEEIENEYGAVKKPSEYEAEMKALRRKVLEIRKAKRMLEEDAIMNVIRVNDDGEIDPDGEHYVSTNPDATAWETKKATGKRGNKEAVEHYKSHLDEFYEKAGIRHVSGEKLELLKDYASAVHDIDDVDDMLDVIMDLSKIRNTATGSWREALSSTSDAIRSKMYRGIEKIGHWNKKGNDAKYKHTYDESKVSQEFIDSVNTEIENAVIAKRNGDTDSIPDVINVTTLGEDSIKKISDFVGFDISGYACKIKKDRITHIDNRHGVNGKADQSLSDPKDVARIGYAINNIDSIEWVKNSDGTIRTEREYKDKNNQYTPIAIIRTKIDGTFCVSEVIPDSSKKTIWITSARIEKADVGSQVSNAGKGLRRTSETVLDSSSASGKSISQGGGNVKVKEHNPIKRNLKKAFGDDIEALREIAVSQMFGMMSDVEARDLGAKAKTGMFICHLMNGATTFRNILSNAAESGRMNFVNNLGYLIERTFTHKGERTIGWENAFSGGKAGWERMRKSRLETALNVDILKNDTSRLGAPLKKRTFTKGPMAVLERGLGYILGATDEYFKGATEYQVKQGLKRYVDNGRLTQAEADKYADEQMLYRTFQNDSKIAEFSTDIRNAFNRWGIGEADENGIKPFGVGDFINAYPLVSGNVLDRVIDVTPVGALKAIYNSYKLAESTYKNKRDIKAIEMPIGGKVSDESKTAAAEAIKTNHDLKRKTILSISSALTNGALIWAGMALFKNGIITGNPSSDEEEDYERAKNNSQYGINISRLGRLLDGDDDGEPKNGDLVMPVGFLGNIYMGLSVGAELVQGNEQEMNFLDNYFSSNVMSAKEQFLSMSMISNINRTVNNFKYSDTIGEGAVATLADVGMMGMPSVVRQFSNAMDDYGRDPYKGATYLDIISGKFKSKIPKVREGEPLRIDLFGEAEVHTLGNKWADIGNNMLSPGIISKYETNVVTQELDKLTKTNKELLNDILPKTPYRNNTGEFENGQAYSFKLDDENYEKYANLLGMTTYKAMHTLVTSDDYKHLTETQKTTALAEISKESAELVKEIWVSHQQGASDSSMQKRIDKYVDSNKAKASKVVKTDNALKYIKLDGVKVEDVIDAGYRVPYTEEEKGEQIAYNYSMISKIRNGTYYDKSSRKYSSSLTAEQRQQLINSFVRSSEDLASGIEQKWISITGEFKNLTDKEKGIVIDQIGYNIDKVRLPDNVGELVDTSVETEPVDLTYPFVPRTSGIINLDWRADEYDKEQSDKKNAESEEESEEEPESKSVEEYLSEYDGEESSEDYKNYPKKYYKKSYGGKSYGGGYSKKSYGGSYGGGYGFVPSVQPVQKNTYRFTPRFGGSGSRFGKKF